MAVQSPNEGILRDLWTLITVTTAPSDALQCARLMATGVPALVPCAFSACALLRERGSSWELLAQRAGTVLAEEDAAPLVPVLDELFNRALRWGDVWTISEARALPPALRKLDLGTLAVVPVRNLRVQFGVLLVGRSGSGAFSQEELFALERLAEHLAMALENLRLRESLERHTTDLERLVEERTGELRLSDERHRALLEMDISLRASMDLDQLLGAIVSAIAPTLPFQRTSLVLWDERQDAFFVHSLAEDADTGIFRTGSRFARAPGSVFEHCFTRREPAVRSYAPPASSFRFTEDRALYGSGYRTLATVPLLVSDRCLGMLNLANTSAQSYSASDLDFVSLVAGRLGAAVDNAQAYQELKRLRDQLQVDNVYLRQEIRTHHGFDEIVGRSPSVVRALDQVEAVAPTDATVLILGETGTGKELIARAVHDRSPRRERPLITLNCAALPSGLVESELFGHEKGAFTGALQRKRGRFELADGGTLFLDEIGEIPLDVQAKLLRVLQEGEFERVGGDETLRVDVRVIAATNRDLRRGMEDGSIRSDLYYRLEVFPIHIPPLRERPEDIPTLALYFAEKAAAKLGRKLAAIRPESLERLVRYSWPGNVRELQNVIERATILCADPELEIGDPAEAAPVPGSPRGAEPPAARTLAEAERRHIERTLRETGGKIEGPGGAARILDIHPSTLRSRMRKLGIRS